jgi:hypothetical protein
MDQKNLTQMLLTVLNDSNASIQTTMTKALMPDVWYIVIDQILNVVALHNQNVYRKFAEIIWVVF